MVDMVALTTEKVKGNNGNSSHALTPLSEMLQYVVNLRSITKGRSTCTIEFSKYEILPEKLQKKLIEARKERHAT